MIGCVRTGKTAAHLQRLGHDVRVLTARDQGPMSRTLRVEIDESRITATTWIGPRRLLDARHKPGASVPASASRVRAVAARAFRGLAYLPDPQAGWIPFAVRAAMRIARDWQPDVILASSGPASSLIAASVLSRRLGVPWVGDLRDLWVDNQNYGYPRWRRPIDLRLQRRVLGSAAGLTTVSEPLADQLRQFGPPVEVVMNGYDDSDYEGITRAPRTTDVLRIVYTGTIYPRQDPRPLFDAIALLKDRKRVSVDFYGAPSAAVMGPASAAGVADVVTLHPSVPHRAALQAQVDADVLLHLLWGDASQPGIYNAKIFEYLRAGRPVLAVGDISNITARLVMDRNAGLASVEPREIAGQMQQWLALLDAGQAIPSLDRSASAGFSRAEQTGVLSRFLEKVGGSRVAASAGGHGP